MYPAQTSFIPVQVALARFLENQGWRAVFSRYPYWYLGTTPFRYLTGPLLPIFSSTLHKILPGLSLFEIMLGIVGVSWVVGGMGVYWLVSSLANSSTSEESPPAGGATVRGVSLARFSAPLATFCYFFGPAVPFLFRFSDGLGLIAFSVLPYVLAWYVRFLEEERVKKIKRAKLVLIISTTFLILLDTSIIPTLILGMVAVFLAISDWKKAEEKIKQTFLLFTFSFLISTLWYTPGYWWQLLVAPSFAGKPLFKVVGQLAQLLPACLAIGLAIVSGKIIKSKDRVLRFCFYWLFIFGFLTLIRFISDPDFWLDWSAYGVELQLGVAVALGLMVDRLFKNQEAQNYNLKLKTFSLLAAIFTFYFLLFIFIFNEHVLGTLQRDITQTVEYKISSQLSRIVKPGEKVFLSGTTAFWLNAFSASWRITQVRGGKDEVAVNQEWRKAAWEIKEGSNTEDTERWLRALNVSYLVVHTQDSEEFYHDFVYPEKFERTEALEKIYDERGDGIYRVLK